MTDSLREKLMSILTGVANVYQSEAEAGEYPYVVFDLISTPVMDKDGVHHFNGDTTIRVVGDEIDDVDTLTASVEGAISSGMHDSTFGSILLTTDKDCVAGIWTTELHYTLKQHADWVEPTPEPTEQTQSE